MITNILLGILIVSVFISFTGFLIGMAVYAFKEGSKAFGILGIVLTFNFIIYYLLFVAYQFGI